MPLPAGLAAAALSALQNPAVQQGLYSTGSSLLGGLGRGANYVAQGAGNIGQRAATGLADRLGTLGQQYLPQSVNTLGSYGRQGLGYLSGGAGGLYNAIMGNNPQQMAPGMQQGGAAGGMGGMALTPQQLMQQNYMQQIQQPFQFNYNARRQQLMNEYNQQIKPQLAAQFAGPGLGDSSYFTRALGGAENNFRTNLEALGEQGRERENQFNLARLGQIGSYLGGQQQLGLGARQLGQQGTIAQRQNALAGLGLMGSAAGQQQQNYINQLTQALNAQGNYANLGMNQPYQTVNTPGGPSGISQMIPFLINALITNGRNTAGI
jgi:hypothetical protein